MLAGSLHPRTANQLVWSVGLVGLAFPMVFPRLLVLFVGFSPGV